MNSFQLPEQYYKYSKNDELNIDSDSYFDLVLEREDLAQYRTPKTAKEILTYEDFKSVDNDNYPNRNTNTVRPVRRSYASFLKKIIILVLLVVLSYIIYCYMTEKTNDTTEIYFSLRDSEIIPVFRR